MDVVCVTSVAACSGSSALGAREGTRRAGSPYLKKAVNWALTYPCAGIKLVVWNTCITACCCSRALGAGESAC